MHDRAVVACRVLAWTLAVGAVGAVILKYDSLPDAIPLSRWNLATKSPFIVLRIPLINLLTMGLVEVLSLSLHRVQQFRRADAVVAVLLLTCAAKASLEAAGILLLPIPFSWTLIPLAVVIAVGLFLAGFFGREFLQPNRWRQLQMTRFETSAALALVVGIAILNLPLVFRPWGG